MKLCDEVAVMRRGKLVSVSKIKDENIFDHDKELNNLEILFTKVEDDN